MTENSSTKGAKTRKIARIASGALAVCLLMVGSFAYFTDRVSTDASATAGTVTLGMTDNINLLDADGKDIYNPGDVRTAAFEIENTGNKSVDVRSTITVTSTVAMDTAAEQAEYELYNASDVELVEGKGYAPKAGATPVADRSISADGTVITYDIPDYVLNGNEDLAEQETEDGIMTDTHAYDYVLVFKGSSANAFQNSGVKLDVLVEAKQHRNTSAGWEIVAQESYTAGSINQDAVPAAA